MDTEDGGERVVANPKVIRASTILEENFEGCFSLPDPTGEPLTGAVERPIAVRVEYLNQTGKRVVEELYSMDARTYLHEFDHLHGILISDHWEASGNVVLTDEQYSAFYDEQVAEEEAREASQGDEGTQDQEDGWVEIDKADLEWEPYHDPRLVMQAARLKAAHEQKRAAALAGMSDEEIAEALAGMEDDERAEALMAMTPEQREVLTGMSDEDRLEALAALSPEHREALANMTSKEKIQIATLAQEDPTRVGFTD